VTNERPYDKSCAVSQVRSVPVLLALLLLLGPGVWRAEAQLPPKPYESPGAPPPGAPPPGAPVEEAPPTQAPVAPLFGPYSPPPEAPAPEARRQPYRRSTGRAESPVAQTERLLLTPSFFVNEAWTDNVFLTNTNKQSDFITQFTPGLQLSFREPGYGLALGYVFTSEIYAKESNLDAAQARQAATFAGFYQITPQLTFNLEGGYAEDNNTTASGIAGISTGRTPSRGGILASGFTWSLDPLTRFQLFGSWYTQRFENTASNVSASSYDTYTFGANASRTITPILTGLASYQFLRSNVSGGADAEYHTIQLGGTYQITQSLSGRLLLGPQITTLGNTGATLALQGSLTQGLAAWGSASLSFGRSQQANGGLGGTSETNTVSASLSVTDVLLRNLTVHGGLSYTTANSGNGQIDTSSAGVGVFATYPVTRWMVAFLAYSYFLQRNSGSELNNINANRITLGVELFYPVRLH
jgi:hypothetical protein